MHPGRYYFYNPEEDEAEWQIPVWEEIQREHGNPVSEKAPSPPPLQPPTKADYLAVQAAAAVLQYRLAAGHLTPPPSSCHLPSESKSAFRESLPQMSEERL